MRKAPVKYGAWVTDGAVQGGAQGSGAQGSGHDSVRGRNCGRARVYDVVPDLRIQMRMRTLIRFSLKQLHHRVLHLLE